MTVTRVLPVAGCFPIVLTVTDDAGATATASGTVVVTAGAPSGAPDVTLEGLPLAGAVIPRDLATGRGPVRVRIAIRSPGYAAVTLRVLGPGGEVVASDERSICATGDAGALDLAASVPAALAGHVISVALAAPGAAEVEVARVADVVAGDVLLVQGQSNAVATRYTGDANVNQHEFLRSFGTRSEDPTTTLADLAWHRAEGNANEGPGAVGQWALRMGRLLVEEQGVPLAILNGARGGRPIAYFQRDDADPTDPTTSYGRLLVRARAAGVDRGVRAILYYQGESDGADATGHHDGWIALHDSWLVDYPTVERTYVTQVRTGCGTPSPALREVQRRFADEVPAVSVMSTNGLDGHDGCHFAYEHGYRELGERYAALLARDLYAVAPAPEVDAPDVARVYVSRADGTELTVAVADGASALAWGAGAEADFTLEGSAVAVTAGRAEGATLVLELGGDGRGATGLTYMGHAGAGPWVRNGAAIGLLSFHAAPIEAGP